MRRVALAVMLVCALSAAVAAAGYKAIKLDGGIGPKGERRPIHLTYEKLSRNQRLVNEMRFSQLAVQCDAPGSDQAVEGVLAAFHQPTEAWVYNKKKDIGGRKNFERVWTGKAVPIEAPDGSRTRFKGKRASFSGVFRDRFSKASGQFSIRWSEIDEDSGEVIYECGTATTWNAVKVAKKR